MLQQLQAPLNQHRNGLSIAEYFASRDPVSGTVYYLMHGVFTAMPWLISRVVLHRFN